VDPEGLFLLSLKNPKPRSVRRYPLIRFYILFFLLSAFRRSGVHAYMVILHLQLHTGEALFSD
jgi:hypothetical protein